MGVAEYQIVQALPAQLETSLPSIEQIESELGSTAPILVETRQAPPSASKAKRKGCWR